MRIFLIEQDMTELYGEYLAQAMVVAVDVQSAIRSVRDYCTACGIGVIDDRLHAYDFGPAPDRLPEAVPIHQEKDAFVYVCQAGKDHDGQTGYPNLLEAESDDA